MRWGHPNAFETAKVKALLDKVPAAYSADKDIVALKEHIATIEKDRKSVV